MKISKSVNFKSSSVRIVKPYPLTRTLLVKPKDRGKKLIDFLQERFSYVGVDEWIGRINRKWLWFSNGEATAESVLQSNQLIYHHSPMVKEPSVPDDVRIILESEEWLVVYKPSPMPMHQGGRYYKNTLSYILSEMGYSETNIVHRLDSVTSGLVLLAKNSEMANRLQLAFSGNEVRKWYYAIVKGVPNSASITVDIPIRRKRGFIFECGHHLENSKPAKTIIELCQTNGEISLVKCTPITGRTHQIRLHLKEAGIPILDDPIYGPDGDETGKQLQVRPILLQSSGLSLDEPSIHAEIGPPESWLSRFGN